MKKRKNKLYILGLLLIVVALSSCSPQSDRNGSVGRTHKLFFDDTRSSWLGEGQRPLAATIWYPATRTSEETDWNIAIFKAGRSALNAELALAPKKFPLVVLSHGTGGAAFQLSWLAERLVQSGFIVLAVNHHGNTGAEESLLLEGFTLWWERAEDISATIDHLLKEPTFGHRIDQTKMGALGFSLGGYSVLSIAGGITDRAQWREFCSEHLANPICELPPEAGVSIAGLEEKIASNPSIQNSFSRSARLFQDKRIKAVYSIAPVLGPALTKESLSKISIPIKIVVGANDDQAIAKYNAEHIANNIPNANLQILQGVSHYTFLAPCTLKGNLLVKDLCSEAKGTKRTEVHKKIGLDAASFFMDALYK